MKNILRKIIQWYGYDIVPRQPFSPLRRKVEETYALLRKHGFLPTTIIDVGVANGTPGLYQAFPEAQLLLIEPLPEYEPQLQAILRQRQGRYALAAAGESDGQSIFYRHPHQPDGSSQFLDVMGEAYSGEKIQVLVKRIDSLVKSCALPGPYLLKIDAQGAELQTLQGAERILNETEVIVMEASLFGFLQGSPQFAEIIYSLKQQGFVAYDILPTWNRPLDDALGQVDIVFVQEQGRFRRSQAFCAPAQFKQIFPKFTASDENHSI